MKVYWGSRLIIPMLFLGSIMGVPNLHAEVKIMPEELIEVADREKCDQISDFFEKKPGPIDPIFVYGYLPGERSESAVFWCRNRNASTAPYSLVFHFRNRQHEVSRCPEVIPWNNPPRGLSIYRNPAESLRGFRFLSDPKRKVPSSLKLKHGAVRSAYDGVEELFYCHDGEWLVRQLH